MEENKKKYEYIEPDLIDKLRVLAYDHDIAYMIIIVILSSIAFITQNKIIMIIAAISLIPGILNQITNP